MKSLLLWVFLTIIASGYGLKCWECIGSKDNCSEDTLADHEDDKLKTCNDTMDTCMKTSTEADGKTRVISSCDTEKLCNEAKEACEKSGQECEVVCCATDKCNASSALSFSVILLAACSVFGLGLLK